MSTQAPANGQLSRPLLWLVEDVSPGYRVSIGLEEVLYSQRDEIQEVQVAKTAAFGKCLVLDGNMQSAQSDEYVYHECLVHPAMIAHPGPTNVFIGGGGELATAREVLRHESVQRCLMVDIDKTVVDMARTQLPEWGAGCFDDPRLEVVYDDAYTKLAEEPDGSFDVIIMDICDPLEAGPGIALYTHEFYRDVVLQKLTPGGYFVTQSGSADIHTSGTTFGCIHNTCKKSFKCTAPYTASIPSFAGHWGWNIAWNPVSGSSQEETCKLVSKSAADIDAEIRRRGLINLRYYDGESHRHVFGIPKPIRVQIAKDKRIITKDKPVFMR